jgi:pimeloyl-ACP methyl ester carboxylesterase
MNTALASQHKSTTVRSWLIPELSSLLSVQSLTRRFPRFGLPLLERLFFSPNKRRPATDATAATRQFEVTVAETKVPVMVWGQGPLVLCVHGWSGSGQQFQALRDHLVEHGYSVALFDARAHGNTAGRRTHVGEFVEVIFRVAEALGPVHLLLGHSLGATASYVAAQRGLPVSGLGLLSPMPSFEFALDSFANIVGIDEATK